MSRNLSKLHNVVAKHDGRIAELADMMDAQAIIPEPHSSTSNSSPAGEHHKEVGLVHKKGALGAGGELNGGCGNGDGEGRRGQRARPGCGSPSTTDMTLESKTKPPRGYETTLKLGVHARTTNEPTGHCDHTTVEQQSANCPPAAAAALCGGAPVCYLFIPWARAAQAEMPRRGPQTPLGPRRSTARSAACRYG